MLIKYDMRNSFYAWMMREKLGEERNEGKKEKEKERERKESFLEWV